jgi:8-oxo-dGTP diphosphatase
MSTEHTKLSVETPRPTHVVTCFLQRTDGGEPRILLVRRSQRVGSYHGHWAGISGFVEPGITPEEQAYTEIREETSLQREQVRMLKRGAIVEHVDKELGRHFYVLPLRRSRSNRHSDRLGSDRAPLDRSR